MYSTLCPAYYVQHIMCKILMYYVQSCQATLSFRPFVRRFGSDSLRKLTRLTASLFCGEAGGHVVTSRYYGVVRTDKFSMYSQLS